MSLKEATMIERYVVFRVECARSRCFIGVLSLNAFVFLRHEATIDSTGFIPADLYSYFEYSYRGRIKPSTFDEFIIRSRGVMALGLFSILPASEIFERGGG